MKKMIYLTAILFLSLAGTATAKAQNNTDAKAIKKEKKAAAAAENEKLFDAAVQALNDYSFVMEADKVEFKRGNFAYVSPTTNFVSLDGKHAIVQLSFNTGRAGANGIGGITVDGNASNISIKTDKKGNVRLKMDVMGKAISATVEIKVMKGNNKAYATVYPNFSGNNISFTGVLLPANESSVYKARPF